MQKLANRDLAAPYKWIDVEPSSAKVRQYREPVLTPRDMIGAVVIALIVLAICAFAIDAGAETLPPTITVQCKDGVVAHDVIGDFQAPCRKHGGTTAVAEGGKPGEPDFVPVGTDDSDFHYVATCTDGTEYWANGKSKKGACDGHGGVKAWADGKPVKHKAVKAYRKAGEK